MRKSYLSFLLFILPVFCIQAQDQKFKKFEFLIGKWSGEGKGFGNSISKINASYGLIMDSSYIEVMHESNFAPTEEKPKGEHHIDKGFISYDNSRNIYVFRQFNIEGYVNQYILNDSLSTNHQLVFETENIENFIPGGKARLSISKINDHEIQTVFDVSFPGKEYACFGTNTLRKEGSN